MLVNLSVALIGLAKVGAKSGHSVGKRLGGAGVEAVLWLGRVQGWDESRAKSVPCLWRVQGCCNILARTEPGFMLKRGWCDVSAGVPAFRRSQGW